MNRLRRPMTLRSVLALLTIILVPLEGIGAESGMNWIRLRSIGWQDQPLPTIWITTDQRFVKKQVLHDVVVLHPAEYNKVAVFARERKCSAFRMNGLRDFGTIEVSEFANGQERIICVLSKDDACGYFLDAHKLAQNQEFGKLIPSIAELGIRIGCKIDVPLLMTGSSIPSSKISKVPTTGFSRHLTRVFRLGLVRLSALCGDGNNPRASVGPSSLRTRLGLPRTMNDQNAAGIDRRVLEN